MPDLRVEVAGLFEGTPTYMKRMRNLRGFTLIELIVVVLILGILAAIAVVGYTNITEKANDAAIKADAKQVVTALSASATLDQKTVEAYVATPEGIAEVATFTGATIEAGDVKLVKGGLQVTIETAGSVAVAGPVTPVTP